MRDRRCRDRWFYNYLSCMQPVPITTNVVSSNPARQRGTRYNIK